MAIKLSLKTFFLLLCCLFLKQTVLSQKKKHITKEIEDYQIRPLNHKNLQKYYNILTQNNSDIGWTKYYGKYAYYMMANNKNDSAIYYANKGIAAYESLLLKTEAEEFELIGLYFALGRAYQEKKQHQESLTNYLKCLEVEKKYPNPLQTYIKTGVANNHLSLGNDSIALKLYKEIYKDTNYIKSGRSKSTTEMRIAILYGNQQNKQQDSTLFYYHKAKNTSLKKDVKNNLVSIYHNLGDFYRLGKNSDSATYYYEKAYYLNLDPAYKPSPQAVKQRNLFSKVNYSYVKIQRGKIKEAILDVNTVLDSLKVKSTYNKDDKGLFLSSYENLALAHKMQGNYEKMQETYKQKERFLTNFHKEQMNQALEELQINFETKEKEEKITNLELENKNQVIIQRQQKYIYFGVITLLLLFLGVIAYYIKQKNLITRYKESVLKQQLLRTQMDPHFFYNALNQVIVLNKLNPAKVEPYTLELSKLTRLILENSREEFVALKKEIEALEKFMALESNFSKQFSYSINIDEDINVDAILIPPMMIQPLAENAILHGISKNKEAGKINVHIKADTSKTILCIVTDNGTGYESTTANKIKSHTSLSQKILEERLEIYHRKRKKKNYIQITSNTIQQNISKGTKVELILPIEEF